MDIVGTVKINCIILSEFCCFYPKEIFKAFGFKQDVPIAHEMVAFHPLAFGRFARAEPQPRHHAFANRHAPVVDNLYFHDLKTTRLEQARRRPTQEYVDNFVDRIRLLTYSEVKNLFPDCIIKKEK